MAINHRIKPAIWAVDPRRVEAQELWNGLRFLAPFWEGTGATRDVVAGKGPTSAIPATYGWLRYESGPYMSASGTVGGAIEYGRAAADNLHGKYGCTFFTLGIRTAQFPNYANLSIGSGGGRVRLLQSGDYPSNSTVLRLFNGSYYEVRAQWLLANTPCVAIGRWESGRVFDVLVYEAFTGKLVHSGSTTAFAGPLDCGDGYQDELGCAAGVGIEWGMSGLWDRCLSDAECLTLATDPYALIRPRRRDPGTTSVLVGQLAEAASILARGGWTDENGTATDAAVLASLQEAGNAKYAESLVWGDVLEVTLDSLLSASGTSFSYTLAKNGPATRSAVVQLRSPDNNSLVREWTHASLGAWQTYTQDVSDLTVSGAHIVRITVN